MQRRSMHFSLAWVAPANLSAHSSSTPLCRSPAGSGPAARHAYAASKLRDCRIKLRGSRRFGLPAAQIRHPQETQRLCICRGELHSCRQGLSSSAMEAVFRVHGSEGPVSLRIVRFQDDGGTQSGSGFLHRALPIRGKLPQQQARAEHRKSPRVDVVVGREVGGRPYCTIVPRSGTLSVFSRCTGSAQGAAQVQGALTLWTLQSVAQPRARVRPLERVADCSQSSDLFLVFSGQAEVASRSSSLHVSRRVLPNGTACRRRCAPPGSRSKRCPSPAPGH
eukprot:scaffold16995_cov127-Isochrysis_galbana.AAC.8